MKTPTTKNIPEAVQKEIDRTKEIAKIYEELKILLSGYENEYLDAFTELADRFESVDA